MKHLKYIAKALLIVVVFGTPFTSVLSQERPNIIFILTDDQSYGMMGCDGNSIVQTPNLDKLSEDGTFLQIRISRVVYVHQVEFQFC